MNEHFETIETILNEAKKRGASYAECRISPLSRDEEVCIENGQITAMSSGESAGYAVRVLVDGSWGFFGGSTPSLVSALRALERAVSEARAGSFLQREPVVLAPGPAWSDGQIIRYRTPLERDPFMVPIDEKVALLMDADRAMRDVSERVFWRIAEYAARETRYLFGSSDGVRTDQTSVSCHAAVYAHVFADGEREVRSAPDSHTHFMQGGFETVTRLNLPLLAHNAAEEAALLLTAKPVPSGVRSVIVLPSMLNLQLHETMHAFEADRVLGSEWTTAGGSFLTGVLGEIGSFRFASPAVTIRSEGDLAGGSGTLAYDLEGSAAKNVPLVENGIWTGLLTSRETIPRLHRGLGREYFNGPTGSVRVGDIADWPLVRMTNTVLVPGETDYDVLREEAPEGTVIFGTNKSWSIDDVRRHFLFSAEIAWEKVESRWEIRRRGKYSGDTLAFWRNCKAVCGSRWYERTGVGTCAKGDPVQHVCITHASSPAMFSNVETGSVQL